MVDYYAEEEKKETKARKEFERISNQINLKELKIFEDLFKVSPNKIRRK